MLRTLIVAAALCSTIGCVSKTAFECIQDEQCTDKGEVGRCEPDGFCSFEDEDCPEGFRYGEASGDLAGQCVGGQDGGPGSLCLDIEQLALGGTHSCALDSGGTVYCWGDNASGQLGDSTLLAKSEPVEIRTLPRIAEMTAGTSHTCARNSDGNVWCWGINSSGQLGHGSTESPRRQPVPVDDLPDAVHVDAGSAHTCAVRLDGTAACWGSNSSGRLGIGIDSGGDSSVPVAVVDPADEDPTDGLDPMTGVVDIAVGNDHACAIVGTGVRCWGSNTSDQLGDDTNTNSSVPVDVMGLTGPAVAITAGNRHTCALLDGGTIMCWGDNGVGQVGNGETGNTAPIADLISGGVTAVQIVAGGDHTCARDAADQVFCWGSNASAQIGNGATANVAAPELVADLGSAATVIGVGGNHTCARLTGGSLQCWGSNSGGQLADASLLHSPDPLPVIAPVTTADELVAGDEFTCARSGASVNCWGANSEFQLGDGTNIGSGTPLSPIETTGDPLANVTALSSGPAMMCVMKSDNTAACWGTAFGTFGNVHGSSSGAQSRAISVVTSVQTPLTDIYVGTVNVFASSTSGGPENWCWGTNSSHICGNATTTSSSSVPVAVDYLAGVNSIANSSSHTCAIVGTGVQCIGSNSSGRLGDPVAPTSDGLAPPIDVPLPAGADQIAVGTSHTCARLSTGAVHCWGSNSSGQLGDESTDSTSVSMMVAKARLPADDAIAVFADGNTSCAIRANNELLCWGQNRNDLFRTGVTTSQSVLLPTQLPGILAADLALGLDHMCVTSPVDGGVQCWGSNVSGQLGDGRSFVSATPTATTIVCEPDA